MTGSTAMCFLFGGLFSYRSLSAWNDDLWTVEGYRGREDRFFHRFWPIGPVLLIVGLVRFVIALI